MGGFLLRSLATLKPNDTLKGVRGRALMTLGREKRVFLFFGSVSFLFPRKKKKRNEHQ
jgi:hypothetical protein